MQYSPPTSAKSLDPSEAGGRAWTLQLKFEPTAPSPLSSTFSIGTALSAPSCSAINVGLAGKGVELTVAPTSLDCGGALVGTPVEKTVTLTNLATDPVTGLTATVSGANASDFTVTELPDSLDAGASALVGVKFEPQAQIPSSTATVTFAGSAGQSATLSLTGKPLTTPLTLTPNPIDFDFVVPGTSVVACTTATNVANVAVSITDLVGLTGTNGAFAPSPVNASTPPLPAPIPVTIAPGASGEVCFTLDPPVPGQCTGQVTLATDRPDGDGAHAPAHWLSGGGRS